MAKNIILPWYMERLGFKPGTVADVGNIRLTIWKAKNNEYRLYMSVRTSETDGVDDNLKQGVLVARYSEKLTLQEVQEKASEIYDISPERYRDGKHRGKQE